MIYWLSADSVRETSYGQYFKSYSLNLVDVTFDFKNGPYVIGDHNA